jgi:hypothetical protein
MAGFFVSTATWPVCWSVCVFGRDPRSLSAFSRLTRYHEYVLGLGMIVALDHSLSIRPAACLHHCLRAAVPSFRSPLPPIRVTSPAFQLRNLGVLLGFSNPLRQQLGHIVSFPHVFEIRKIGRLPKTEIPLHRSAASPPQTPRSRDAAAQRVPVVSHRAGLRANSFFGSRISRLLGRSRPNVWSCPLIAR